jgi:excisionase family DNA binding protein
MTDRLALRIEDAAELAGVSKVTIHRWVTSGRLRSFKVGRRRIIVREDLPTDGRREEEFAMKAFLQKEAALK